MVWSKFLKDNELSYPGWLLHWPVIEVLVRFFGSFQILLLLLLLFCYNLFWRVGLSREDRP